MKICHLSSEFTPFIKAGGLADIVYGLSLQFHEMGHFVRVMLPYFSSLEESLGLTLVTSQLECSFGGKKFSCTIKRGVYEGVELLLIDPNEKEFRFEGKPLYGNSNDIEKFALFSCFCVQYLKLENATWDIVHCHDWVTSLAVVLFKDKGFNRTLLTIHNAAYQGIGNPNIIQEVPLENETFRNSLFEKDHLNLLKAGIMHAGKIVTVSPSYRKELLSEGGEKNLQNLFEKREKDFFGILNGLDDRFWNPTLDPFLPCHFDLKHLSFDQIDQILLWKRMHRQFLQTDLHLSIEGPLLISIGRLVDQKSPDLILEAGKTILEKGGAFVLLGSTHDKLLEKRFLAELPSSSHCKLLFGFDERLSHILFAAADMICVPSRFEPCGLTQLIGMRYGVIPIVRKIGGLADTVFDIETSTADKSKQCGFTFDHDNKQGLHWGLDRAIQCYFENRTLWNNLVFKAMSQDFSWKSSSLEYQKLYESLNSSSEPFAGIPEGVTLLK